ncbi:perforin-1-like [Hemiscyllium ocellatum]|uniref:perforin-1-like n=1 Tax=Hemiscyllium ocellatum TaxID=170820 RepID=UPI002965D5DF|nr:perforin-1-like [Hemiscyllium ocellatum]
MMLGRWPRPTALPLVCLLLLSLATHGVRGLCETGSADECQAAAFVPGAQLAGEGYDVVTLRTTGAFVVDVDTWRAANGSCTLCRNELLDGARQRLPLALADWRAQSSCSRALSSQLYRSAAELVKTASSALTNDWRADLHLPLRPNAGAQLVLAGSRSKVVTFGATRARSDRYGFTSQGFQCRYYRYRVREQPPLAPDFARSLAHLPGELTDASRPLYRQLVAAYGTHYLRSVELGGSLRDVTAFRTCQLAAGGHTAEEAKDCLALEATATVEGVVQAGAGFNRCREMARALGGAASVHQALGDRETEVKGGRAQQGRDLFFGGGAAVFTRWADSLPAHPGAVSYALAPLHHLLPPGHPARVSLRRYLEEYVGANALLRQCGQAAPCPPGSYRDPRRPCSCLCPEGGGLDRSCCPGEKGLGRLVVTVKEGRDLWGDTFSGTDGYVVVKYGQAQARTPVVWDNNNPKWDAKLDLGTVRLTSGHRLTVEVWDSEKLSRDDLLGSCQCPQLAAGARPSVCYLKYGAVTYAVSLTCLPHLGGSTCQDYAPRPDSAAFGPLLPAARPSGTPPLAVVYP